METLLWICLYGFNQLIVWKSVYSPYQFPATPTSTLYWSPANLCLPGSSDDVSTHLTIGTNDRHVNTLQKGRHWGEVRVAICQLTNTIIREDRKTTQETSCTSCRKINEKTLLSIKKQNNGHTRLKHLKTTRLPNPIIGIKGNTHMCGD